MATATVAYEEAAERTTAHPFFISYWRRSEKREALIWAKDEKSAVGLFVSAVPDADIRFVEQRDVEAGMKRGRNVYAVGETSESQAEEYVAVDSRGRRVFGPTKNYEQAKMHAERTGGVVKFEMGASDCVGVHTHGETPPAIVMAGEGPHSQPVERHGQCSKDSAIEIASQIPGGPWAYVKSYPKEAPARIERQQDFVVKGKTVTALFCGRHLLLRCPTSGTQYLFEGACVGDVPGKQTAAAPQGVQPATGKPYVVRVKSGARVIAEGGPFATPTEAWVWIETLGDRNKDHPVRGELAGIYRDGKLIDFRGGKAAYAFGRTRWSRA